MASAMLEAGEPMPRILGPEVQHNLALRPGPIPGRGG